MRPSRKRLCSALALVALAAATSSAVFGRNVSSDSFSGVWHVNVEPDSSAQQSGKLHHAWLLTGPRGIGKATLAWRFARFLLAGQEGGLFGAPDSLDVATDAPGRNLIDARVHSGLFHLRRSLHPKDNRIRDEIAVDDVRELSAFMRKTEEGWRVAIVDSADEMNRNSANAILKILEEPRPNSVLLIVAHASGRLLPTIRSRCRRLRARRHHQRNDGQTILAESRPALRSNRHRSTRWTRVRRRAQANHWHHRRQP